MIPDWVETQNTHTAPTHGGTAKELLWCHSNKAVFNRQNHHTQMWQLSPLLCHICKLTAFKLTKLFFYDIIIYCIYTILYYTIPFKSLRSVRFCNVSERSLLRWIFYFILIFFVLKKHFFLLIMIKMNSGVWYNIIIYETICYLLIC